MADLKVVKRIAEPINLRAPESTIKDYNKLDPKDVKDLDRQDYATFAKRLRDDPVRVMLEASDLGMGLEQYANLRSPETLITQRRSVISRVMEEDGLFVQDSDLTAASPVDLFMDNGYRQAVLYSILNKAWDGSALAQRAPSIQLPTSQGHRVHLRTRKPLVHLLRLR